MIVFVLAMILSIVNFLSEAYSYKFERFHTGFVSFSAGLFITFIFIELLPQALNGLSVIGDKVYIIILSGFVLFHLSEKYVYQHIRHKKHMLNELAVIHISGFFIYHLVIGILLFLSFSTGIDGVGWFTFALLLTHIFSSSISLTHIDEFLGMNKLLMIVLSAAPLAGTLIASIAPLSPVAHHGLFSFVVGAVLYIVSRDMLPSKQEGSSKHFFLGFMLSLAAIILARAF